MTADADAPIPEDLPEEERIAWTAKQDLAKAFRQIRTGRIDSALDLIEGIKKDQYLKTHFQSMQDYLSDFSEWYKAYTALEEYMKKPKNERKKQTQPGQPREIRDFIKDGVFYDKFKKFLGKDNDDYEKIVPYYLIKLANDSAKTEELRNALKKNPQVLYKTYIDAFVGDKETQLLAEDANVICLYVYALYEDAIYSYDASKKKEKKKKKNIAQDNLKHVKKETEQWCEKLEDNGSNLSIQRMYLKRAVEQMEKGINDNPFSKKNRVDPYLSL